METKENLNKGITLVALVITIIILLIFFVSMPYFGLLPFLQIITNTKLSSNI